MSRLLTRCGTLALAVVFATCGGGDPVVEQAPSVSSDTSSSAEGYVAIEVVDGGSLRGTVRFVGDVPEARVLPVSNDSEACGIERTVQPVQVGPDRGLADAVVSLVDARQGSLLDVASPPTLDQRRCTFSPRVLLAPTGVPVRVLNSDPLTHNVHTAAFENRSVNHSQPSGLEVIELNFDVAEKVKVKCDLHPWMSAWIVVVDHPYHAITSETGSFELSNVPPGDYVLETWHETLGTSRRAVTVRGNETLDLRVDLVVGD